MEEKKNLKTQLLPISTKDFREIAKGCGIKYRNKIPSKELKEMLGYCPLKNKRKVEVSDETGFRKEYQSLGEAAKDCGISNSSAIKYALDNQRNFIKRRSDQKKLFVREIWHDVNKTGNERLF